RPHRRCRRIPQSREAPARPHPRNRAHGLAGPESHRRSRRRRLRVLWRYDPFLGFTCQKICQTIGAETRKLLSYLEAPVGIEPTNRGFADLCLTTWLRRQGDRKSTRLNSSHVKISYGVFCLE